MKRVLITLNLLLSIQSFATGGFACESENGTIAVYGTEGTGGVLLNEVHVYHSDIPTVIKLEPSMKWMSRRTEELRLMVYDVSSDITRLKLEATKGKGKLSLNLADMETNGYDILISELNMKCIFE